MKRNAMDNGATVLDTLGDDNYIGLRRSSLSGQPFSGIFINMKEKVLAWKPDVTRLWNLPKGMKNFIIDSQKSMIASSGSHFHLLLPLGVLNQHVEPLPEGKYSAPLRLQLADFTLWDNFVWVDRCYRVEQLWAPELALSTGWCILQRQLGGE